MSPSAAVTAAIASLFLLGPARAAGEPVEVRLIPGAPAADGSLRAGVDIRLAPGWKTYWINPGPTGLPPRLDFKGSDNLASAEPLWPAPVRFDDGGTSSIGYSGRVIVPLRVTALDRSKPVRLKAVLDYGVCENICVPARAELSAELSAGSVFSGLAALELKGFEARVPKPSALGDTAPFAVTDISRTAEGAIVRLRVPPGTSTSDLFASGDRVAVSVPKPSTEAGSFTVRLKSAEPGATLSLVAVADGEAIAVPVPLDDLPARP